MGDSSDGWTHVATRLRRSEDQAASATTPTIVPATPEASHPRAGDGADGSFVLSAARHMHDFTLIPPTTHALERNRSPCDSHPRHTRMAAACI
jgi:hypothetical protein